MRASPLARAVWSIPRGVRCRDGNPRAESSDFRLEGDVRASRDHHGRRADRARARRHRVLGRPSAARARGGRRISPRSCATTRRSSTGCSPISTRNGSSSSTRTRSRRSCSRTSRSRRSSSRSRTHGAELKNAALTTAEVTGALGYMDYGEVSRYASIYDLQAQFMRLQERQGQHFFDVLAFVRHIPDADRPADDDVRRWRVGHRPCASRYRLSRADRPSATEALHGVSRREMTVRHQRRLAADGARLGPTSATSRPSCSRTRRGDRSSGR